MYAFRCKLASLQFGVAKHTWYSLYQLATLCPGKPVPPPTVPTSREGIVQVIYKSSLFSPQHSIPVEQLLDVTFCAGSWPVARKTAVTMLAACALLPRNILKKRIDYHSLSPPILPAIALPPIFFNLLHSTNVLASVFNTLRKVAAGIIHSVTTRLPRPLIQLIAAGFLSQQKLPLNEIICISGNSRLIHFNAISAPFETIFIPMASPVKATKPARLTLEKRTQGARVMPTSSTYEVTPRIDKALQPRLVEATKAPSVVAMGTKYFAPSKSKGPA
ncbi:hypothetical protein FF38_05226 [Lucilia cuprina]|uniref:Uncharacterized protein n=1 Tax=Lucilia cuprina TaxID=7375 RepID=A0A0L0CBH6_LUCCU|nr:hypothetical protein FF38_05226 [Lucilia cuprina]